MASTRCFDCLQEFAATADRFVVLKQMRDFPADWQGDDIERRRLESLLFDQVFVCADCAAWYGDHPIQLAAIEADPEHGRAE